MEANIEPPCPLLDRKSDIAGFTAWSSAREPPQVFTLLECIYGAFDKLANRFDVFKVETIGDCYGKILISPMKPKHGFGCLLS